MHSVSSISSSAAALLSMQPAITHGGMISADASSNHVIKSADPRSAFALSMEAADRIYEIIQKTKQSQMKPTSVSEQGSERGSGHELPLDEQFWASMASTPPEIAAELKSSGATRCINTSEKRLDGEDLVREVKSVVLEGVATGNHTRMGEAIMDGTAQIIRGNDIPELGFRHYDYTYYVSDPLGGERHGGQISGSSANNDFAAKFRESHPGLEMSTVQIDGNIALVIYPKTPIEPQALS